MTGPATRTVRIDARNDDYRPDDRRRLGQVATLHGDLRTVADVAVRAAPTGGTKGRPRRRRYPGRARCP